MVDAFAAGARIKEENFQAFLSDFSKTALHLVS
jgi:hypothetical protein